MSSCTGYVGNQIYLPATLFARHSTQFRPPIASLVGSVPAMSDHNSMRPVPVFPRNTSESLAMTRDQMALSALTDIVRLLLTTVEQLVGNDKESNGKTSFDSLHVSKHDQRQRKRHVKRCSPQDIPVHIPRLKYHLTLEKKTGPSGSVDLKK